MRVIIASIVLSMLVPASVLLLTTSATPAGDGAQVTCRGGTCPLPTYSRAGEAVARADIERGELRLKVWGLPGPSFWEYERILLETYDIHLDFVGGCFGPMGLDYDAERYNDIVRCEIERRFGDGVLENASSEALHRWRQARAGGA